MSCIKLCALMSALGLVAVWITSRAAGEESLSAAAWQLGALIGFMVVSGKVHDLCGVGNSKTLAITWALSLAAWLLTIVTVTFASEGDAVWDDLRIVGTGLIERVKELF